LSILSELFEPLQRIDELDVELAEADVSAAKEFPVHLTDRLEHFEEQFDEAIDELAEAQRAFEHDTDLSTEGYREWLLDNEDETTALDDERKLWAETIGDLSEQERELVEQRREIESDISDLHSDWDESFSHIEAIETSSVDTARVDDLVSDVSKLREKRDDLREDLSSDRSRREALKDKLSGLEESDETETEVTLPKQKPLIIAAVAVGVGTGTSLVTSPVVGGVVGLVIIAVGMYAIDSTVTVEPSIDTEPRRELKATIATLDGDIRASQEQLEGIDEKLGEKEDELSELVEELGLPEDLPPKQVASFYTQVVELNKKIRKYRQDRSQWEEERDALASELDAVASLLEDVQETSWSKDSPLENASTLLSTLESAAADLQLAIDVRVASQEREDAVEDIDAVLTSWDEEKSIDESTDDETIYRRIQAFRDQADDASAIVEADEEREQLESQVTSRLDSPSAEKAFAPVREDDEPLVEVAERETAEFADVEAIQDEIRDSQAEIEDLEEQRDELRDRCLELEKERDELASEEDLREAQAKIDEGRVEFERVGEAYAVNRIAEEMVSRLHERLMQDVVHSLVDDASEIFSSITQEYDGIELGGELQDLEFRALRSTRSDHSVGELSRATAEQLFLAIRLARIRQTDAELPVVLDDAATNFDPDHISRVFEVVGELASTNQVFFLTCHPEFVNLTAAADSPAQYWSLEDGVFTRTDDAGVLERRLMAD
jgi:chromosome segregation ATPase